MKPPNEHFVKRGGWVVVLCRADRSEFMAYGRRGERLLDRAFFPTRQMARMYLKELRSHKMGGYVSRATITLQRHR